MPKITTKVKDFSRAYSLLPEAVQTQLESALARSHIVDMFASLPFGGGLPGSIAILMAASEDHDIDATLLSMESIVNTMDDDCDQIDFTGALFLSDYLAKGRLLYREKGLHKIIGRIPRI